MNKIVLISSCAFCLALSGATQNAPVTPKQMPDKTHPTSDVSKTLTGKWTFVFDTEGGDRTYQADLQQDGEKVSGKWANKAAVKGTFLKDKLSLEFPTDSDEVGPGTLKIDGELTDVLKGSWSFQSYSGTFTATREKS